MSRSEALRFVRDVLLIAAAVLVLVVLAVPPARADTIDIAWTAPTQREDGTALTAAEIAGYRLSWTVNGVAQAEKTLTPGTGYALDTGALVGRVCVVLRTVDTDGLESAPTGEVCRKARPKPPSSVRAR